MNNRKALYVLLAALALAALTNRWMLGGPKPGFNIVNFDDLYFTAQWIAFALTLSGLALLVWNWHASGRFPMAIVLGALMIFYFFATGIPQTANSYQWAAGNVGLTRWRSAWQQHQEEAEIAPRLTGTWKSPTRTYELARDALTITSAGKAETLNVSTCASTSFALIFRYATDAIFHSNPAAVPYYKLLDGARVPALEAVCPGRSYTFLLRPDDTLIAFHNLHERDPMIETLVRVR